MKKQILFASLVVFAVMFSCSESLPTGNNEVEKTDEAQVAGSSEVENVEFAMDYEPVISRFEDALAVINAKQMTGEEITADDKAALDEAVKEIDKYEDASLNPNYQFRYNAAVERLAYLIENGVLDY